MPHLGTIAKKISENPLAFDSPRAGGIFTLTPSAQEVLARNQLSTLEKNYLTAWLVDKRNGGESNPVVFSETIEGISEPISNSLIEKRDKFLIWMHHRTRGMFGQDVWMANYDPSDAGVVGAGSKSWDESFTLRSLYEATALCGARKEIEIVEIVNYLKKSNLVQGERGVIKLTFEGHEQINKIRTQAPSVEQVFVAMWFGQPMLAFYEEGFKLGIEDAGYRPIRIDRKDHNNKIDDEIVAEIRRSKFVVADFTSDVLTTKNELGIERKEAISRGGVYFEAGFAKGLGREVIWTARFDLIELVHFDTRQFNHIVWNDAADLRKQLSQRISATLGDGPLKKK